MARGADDQRQHRRAADDLDKGLRRADAERALDAYVRLAPALRGAYLPRVAALFSDAVRRAEQQWSRSSLLAFARRADEAPELLMVGITPRNAALLAWPLFVATLATGELPRARRLFPLFSPLLKADEPALLNLITAALENEGRVNAAALVSAGVVVPKTARTKTQEASAPLMPASPTELPSALVALVSSRPWTQSVQILNRQWLPRTSKTNADPLRRDVLGLCLREMLLAKRSARTCAPAVIGLAIRCVDELSELATVREDVLLLVRLAHEADDSADKNLPKLLVALTKDPEFGPMATSLACSLGSAKHGTDGTLDVLKRLWALTSEAPLCFRALDLWSRAHTPDCEHDLPAWLVRGIEAMPVETLAAWTLGDGREAVHNFIDWMSVILDSSAFDQLAESAWNRADSGLRADFARAIAQSCYADDEFSDDLFDDLLNQMGMPGSRRSTELCADHARVERFLPRMLTASGEFLHVALATRPDRSEALALLKRFYDEGGTARAAQAAVIVAAFDQPTSVSRVVIDDFLKRFASDLTALAQTLRELTEASAPHMDSTRFADAFLDALDVVNRELTPLEAAAETVARALTGRRKHTRRWPPKAPKAPKTKAAKPKAAETPGATSQATAPTARAKKAERR